MDEERQKAIDKILSLTDEQFRQLIELINQEEKESTPVS